MQHPDEGTIHAWLDGALPPTEQPALADHVMQCPECRAAVAEARGMMAGASRIVAALDVVRGGVLPRVEEKRGWSAWRMLRLTPARAAIAATLMVAAASVLAIRHEKPVARLGSVTRDSGIGSRESTVARPAIVAGIAQRGRDSVSGVAKAVGVAATGRVRRDSVSVVANSELRRDTAPLEAAKATAASPVSAPSPAPPPQAQALREQVLTQPVISQPAMSPAAAPAFARVRAALDANAQEPVTGCYRISNDSGAGQSIVPLRFALQHGAPSARGGPMRNVALPLSPAGQVDTLEGRGVWLALSQTTVSVVWTPQAALTMTFGPAGVVGEIPSAAGGTAHRVGIARMECAF